MTAEIQKFLFAHLGTDNFELIPVKKGGSDRSFFRVLLPDGSGFIFMHYGTDVAENAYWADINKFLAGLDIAVPQIITRDIRLNFILIEDLGDTDLWSQRHLSWKDRRGYYRDVLRQIRSLHAFDFARIPAGLKLSEGYGEKLYRFEHNYFLENFAGAVCGIEIPVARQKCLAAELDGLISFLREIPSSLIHRDLQSQNIMLNKGKPVLIDFQGMRQGCLFYDLGSLIFDPYVALTGEERDDLLDFYYALMKPDYGRDEFTANFISASVQRLMQALGAYGFLGIKKKKTDFLRHVENGLANLTAAVSATGNLPRIAELAFECRDKIANRSISQ